MDLIGSKIGFPWPLGRVPTSAEKNPSVSRWPFLVVFCLYALLLWIHHNTSWTGHAMQTTIPFTLTHSLAVLVSLGMHEEPLPHAGCMRPKLRPLRTAFLDDAQSQGVEITPPKASFVHVDHVSIVSPILGLFTQHD